MVKKNEALPARQGEVEVLAPAHPAGLPVLDPDDIVRRDLSVDPPDGWPRLTPKLALWVQRRLAHPDETEEASRRAVGYASGHAVSTKAKDYLAACARYVRPGALSVADQRRLAVQRLIRTIQSEDDREATMAAKVLEGYLPKITPETEGKVGKLGFSALVDRLRETLSGLGVGELEDLMAGCPSFPTVYGQTVFPGQGKTIDRDQGGGGSLKNERLRPGLDQESRSARQDDEAKPENPA